MHTNKEYFILFWVIFKGTRVNSEVMHLLFDFKILSLKGCFLHDSYKNLNQ
jgi:hypothetical protein